MQVVPGGESKEPERLGKPEATPKEKDAESRAGKVAQKAIPGSAVGGSTTVIRPRKPVTPASSSEASPATSPQVHRRKSSSSQENSPSSSPRFGHKVSHQSDDEADFVMEISSTTEESRGGTPHVPYKFVRKTGDDSESASESTSLPGTPKGSHKAVGYDEAKAKINQEIKRDLEGFGNFFTHIDEILNNDKFLGWKGPDELAHLLAKQPPNAAVLCLDISTPTLLGIAFKDKDGHIQTLSFGRDDRVEDVCMRHQLQLVAEPAVTLAEQRSFSPDEAKIAETMKSAARSRAEMSMRAKESLVARCKELGITNPRLEEIVSNEKFAGEIGDTTLNFILTHQTQKGVLCLHNEQLVIVFKNDENHIVRVPFTENDSVEDLCRQHGITLLEPSRQIQEHPQFQGFAYVNLLRLEALTVDLKGDQALPKSPLTMLDLVQREELTSVLPLQKDTTTSLRDKYGDVKPYRHNMVPCAVTWDNPECYLNASFVRAGGRLFLACQGPLNQKGVSTAADIWSAALSNNSKLLLSLGPDVEDFRVKFSEEIFLDAVTELTVNTSFGKCVIQQTKRNMETKSFGRFDAKIITREYSITKEDGTVTTLKAIHLATWPDHGVVPPELLSGLVDSINSECKDSADSVTVHCSAGIGRTGTVICAYDTAKRIERGETTIPLGGTVTEVRAQRLGSVQTPEQLALLASFARHRHSSKKQGQ